MLDPYRRCLIVRHSCGGRSEGARTDGRPLRGFSSLTLNTQRMYCAFIDIASCQGRMDEALFTRFNQAHCVWLILARNAFIQFQCPSPTPRLVTKGARCARTSGMVEPREGTGAVFAAPPATAIQARLTRPPVYGAGSVALAR